MKRTIVFALVATLSVVVSGNLSSAEKDKKDLSLVALDVGGYNTFLSAMKQAGLESDLTGKGPITVFAPTDDAFKKIPKDKLDGLLKDKDSLKKVLKVHYIPKKEFKTADIVALDGNDFYGFKIKANKDGIMIGDAKVIGNPAPASNGLLYGIDTVLMPVAKPEK